MGLEQIIPAIFLIAILILALPGFLISNSKSKQFFKNCFSFELVLKKAGSTNIRTAINEIAPNI